MDTSATRLKHEHLANSLRRQITRGELSPGERLPSERQMASVRGVSPGTVRRALATLVQEGIVEPRDRSGVYVCERLRQKIVGVMVPNIANPDHQAMVEAVSRIAANRGFTSAVFIRGSDNAPFKGSDFPDLAFIDNLAEMDATGVIACPLQAPPLRRFRQRLRDLDLPFVIANDYWAEPGDEHCVRVDQEADVAQVVDFLVDLGHRRIGLWMKYEDSWSSTMAACRERLASHDLSSHDVRGLSGGPSEWVARHVRDRPSSSRPTALIIPYYSQARAVLHMLAEAGCQVPREISLVSLGGPHSLLPGEVRITATVAPIERLAAHAFSLLLESEPGTVCQHRLQSRLTPGDTTVPPPSVCP